MRYYKVNLIAGHAGAGEYREITRYLKAKNLNRLIKSLHYRKGIKKYKSLPLTKLEEISKEDFFSAMHKNRKIF